MVDNEAIAIGTICLILALIGTVLHMILLVILLFQKRHSSPIDAAYMPNSLYSRSRVSSRKRNVSSSFFISLWLCLLFDLMTRLTHDAPSIFVGRHLFGSNVASIIAWFARCLFYSSIFHSVLIMGSGYCNRFDHSRSVSETQIRCTCLASKLRSAVVTLICWLLSVTVATVIKYSVCEYQFDPRMYGYVCVHSIHYEGAAEKPSTRATRDETKILVYVDGSIIGAAILWLIYGNWAIRRETMKRRRLVGQARSGLSMDDTTFSAPADRDQSSGTQERSEVARMRSTRLIALTAILLLRYICHLLVLDLGRNRWHYFCFTFTDLLCIIACPVVYVLLTKPLRDLVPGSGYRNRNPQIALTDVSGNAGVNEDNRSLFSFTQAPATFTSPISDQISTASLTRVAEISPFTTDAHLNNSPSMSSRIMAPNTPVLIKRLEPQSNRSRLNFSSARYLSVDSSAKNGQGSTVSADVHRSDIYAISSFHSFGKLPKVNLSPKAKQNGRSETETGHKSFPSDRVSPKAKRCRRSPKRSSSSSKEVEKTQNHEPPSPSAMTDIESTTSDTSSCFTRSAIAMRRRHAWTKEDSMENFETTESLQERAAAARRFVEAYEAKNARLHHSLASGGGKSVPALGDFGESGNWLSAIQEGGISMKRLFAGIAMDMDYETKGNETRCYQDG